MMEEPLFERKWLKMATKRTNSNKNNNINKQLKPQRRKKDIRTNISFPSHNQPKID